MNSDTLDDRQPEGVSLIDFIPKWQISNGRKGAGSDSGDSCINSPITKE